MGTCGPSPQPRAAPGLGIRPSTIRLPRLQKTSGGSTASSSEDELGGDGDDAVEAIGPADMVGPRTVGDPTRARAGDAAEDGCIAESHLK